MLNNQPKLPMHGQKPRKSMLQLVIIVFIRRNQMKPHVHAEVIKAWADGAVIEFNKGCDPYEWREVINGTPAWHENVQYRVKPEPIVKYHGIMQGTDGYEHMNHNTGYHAELSHVRYPDDKWKVIAIVKTTFVDRVPVAVEIVK